jgi:hypothetical protein
MAQNNTNERLCPGSSDTFTASWIPVSISGLESACKKKFNFVRCAGAGFQRSRIFLTNSGSFVILKKFFLTFECCSRRFWFTEHEN